ncbi:MAG: hypothetical protein GY898_10510 [Proteobacteria bacterium]|nr:hypothetical protein [Pseudomonadota bacterium]
MRLSGLMLILGLAGCAAPAGDVVLWNDSGFAWESMSHPVALLHAGASPGDAQGEVVAERGLAGGADGADFGVAWTTVRSRSVRATYGATELRIGPDGRALTRESIPLRDLTAANVYAVVLAGVTFDSDTAQAEDYPGGYEPGDGWPVRGIGAALGTAEIADDTLSFDVSAHFQSGALGGWVGDGIIPFATVAAEVRWVVVAVSSGALITEPVELTASYAVGGLSETPHEPIDEAERNLTLVGAPGLAVGVPVLRAWDFEFNRDVADSGRNLRALSAGFEAFDYEPATGEASAIVDAYASIESAVQPGDLEVEFVAELALLQIDDPGAVVIEGSLRDAIAPPGIFDAVVTP